MTVCQINKTDTDTNTNTDTDMDTDKTKIEKLRGSENWATPIPVSLQSVLEELN